MRKLLGLLLALMLAVLPLTVFAATKVIDPASDFYLTDDADVISEETEGLIVLNNERLYDACGAQIVFVTLDTVGSAGMENYAYTLFNEWGIGSAKKNNGVLVLLAIEDDDYWLLQGKGIQDDLTSGDLDELAYTYLEPSFAEKDYDTGVRLLFAALFERVRDIEGVNLALDETLYDEWLAAQEGDDETEISRSTEQVYGDAMPQSGGFNFGTLLLPIIFLLIVGFIVRRIFRAVRVVGRGAAVPPPMPHHPPVPPMPPRTVSRPPRPNGGFGGMGGSRPSGFGGSRPSGFGGSRPSGFGGGRSGGFSSSRSSGSRSFSSHSGGGGGSRGGGAGRHR